MKKLILSIAFSAIGVMCVAAQGVNESAAAASGQAKPKVKRSELIRQSMMRRFGGLVARPDSYRGKITVANATGLYKAEIDKAIAEFTKNLKIRIETGTSEKPNLENVGGLMAKMGGQAYLFVTEDDVLPAILAAPENKWVIVNLKNIKVGAATPEVVSRRVRCEIARGLAYLAGAAGSTFPNSLMTAIESPKGLDYVTDEMPPAEVFSRMPQYLKALGITPLINVPYSLACEEGWAQQPTNEYQKAIWDKVHAMPTAPLKIKPETKKVTE